MHQETQQCAIKGSEEEDCKQVNVEISNAGFKILHLRVFYEKGNAFTAFVRPQGVGE